MKQLACLALFAAVLTSSRAAADDDLKLLFLGDTRPVLIAVRAEIEGTPIRATWTEYMRRWFDYLDPDRDGSLSVNESKVAPHEDLLWQAFRQGLFFPRGNMAAPRFETTAGAVNFTAFCRHYEKKIGPYQFDIPTQATTISTSDALLDWLDRNKDKVLAKEEITAAATSLDVVDKVDDEVVTAEELAAAPTAALAGAQFAIVQGSPPAPSTGSDSFAFADDQSAGKNALLILTLYDRDKDGAVQPGESGLAPESYDRLDKDGDGKLNVQELGSWHTLPADLHITHDIGVNPKGPRIRASGPGVEEKEGAVIATLGDAQITLKPGNGARLAGLGGRTQVFMQQFKLADKDKRGFLTKSDVQGGQIAFFAQLFPLVDANGDDKMTEQELSSFVALQDAAKDSFAALAIADQGRAFFQILDTNRDNRLTLRELRSAWSRLEPYDRDRDGAIAIKEVAKQFQFSVQRGQSIALVRTAFAMRAPGGSDPPAPTNGPLWFRRMDLNNDSDVSPREFLGTLEQFRRIDADGDGLIDAREASNRD